MMRKILLLSLALLLPGAIFLFLHFFGKNEFDDIVQKSFGINLAIRYIENVRVWNPATNDILASLQSRKKITMGILEHFQ